PGVLTPWQASILHELYRRGPALGTGRRAEGPGPVPRDERRGGGARGRGRAPERLGGAVGTELPVQTVKAHLAMMADRYVATTGVQRMAEHLRMFQRPGDSPGVPALFHHH